MDHQVSPLTIQVRDELKSLMELNGLGLRGLGREAGVSASTVRRVLLLEQVPTLDLVYQLFQAMGVEPSISMF